MKIERMKEDDLFDHMDSVELLDIEQVENGCIIITNSSELFNTKNNNIKSNSISIIINTIDNK